MRKALDIFSVTVRRDATDKGTAIAVLATDHNAARNHALIAYRRRYSLPTSANLFASIDLRGAK